MADNPLSLSLKARIKILEQENTELKRQIQTLSKYIPKDSSLDISDEQSICEIEIRRLRDIALNRPLNLEETKKLDILVKTLKGLNEVNKKNVIEVTKPTQLSINDLMQIVGNDGQDGQEETSTETGSDS